MKQIDVRFTASDIEAIKSMIGKKMLKYKCDPFEFSTSVYGIVGISLEDASYAFTNFTEVMDYYGEQEDVALFKMEAMSFSKIHSFVQDQTMIETPVDNMITPVTAPIWSNKYVAPKKRRSVRTTGTGPLLAGLSGCVWPRRFPRPSVGTT